jgi:TolB-like protein/DNA-binding winged helix-turn-helix (wHTH) protein
MTPPSDALPTHYRFGDLTLDTARRSVSRHGQPIELKALDFDLLRFLVESAPNVVNADALAEKVWGRHFVSPENVAQRVMLLRQSLSDDANRPRYIETVRNKGYRLIPLVNTMQPEETHISTRRGPVPAGALMLAVCLVAVAGYRLTRTSGPPAPLPSSIAVLPFENLSPDPDHAFFAAGLHGEILSQLAKIAALNVIGQPSTQRLAESGQSAQEIAAVLNVETVLYATVEYAGGRVRIRPQLISGATGQTVWAESYDRAFENIFAIESEIAAEVANALKAQFTIAEQAAVDTPATSSTEAHEAYLRARYVQGASPAIALEYLDEATRHDPRYPLAYAAKAEILAASLVAQFGREAAAPSEWNALEERVVAAADEALRLDPDLWLARHALGTLHERRWRWTQARAEYDRAAPFTPRGVRRMGDAEPFLRDLDFTDFLREQRAIVTLNPLVAFEHWVLGLGHAYSGDAVAASVEFREAVSLEPDRPIFRIWLGHTHGILGRRDEALAELRRAEQLPRVHDTGLTIANLAYAYAQNGSPGDARRLFDVLATKAPDRRHQAGNWALAYLAVGDFDAARVALETVIEKIAKQEPDAGHLTLRLIRTNIYSDAVLEQPEFVALRAQLRGR